MNEADFDAIRQRLNAASRGPWQAEGAEVRAADGDLVADTLYEDRTYDDSNVEFIAHAPEDVAALLAEVDRLRTQLAEAEATAQMFRASLQGQDPVVRF